MNIVKHNNKNRRFTASIQVNLEDFVGAKFYSPHALADGNQRIRIREKTLEFSSTVNSVVYTVSVPLNEVLEISTKCLLRSYTCTKWQTYEQTETYE